MFNYNREVYLAEYERAQALREAAERSLPYHLRSNKGKRARYWFSTTIWHPAGQLLGAKASVVFYHGGRYWRRASTRVVGLITNFIGEITEHVPGRV